jgi:hypothetical protein
LRAETLGAVTCEPCSVGKHFVFVGTHMGMGNGGGSATCRQCPKGRFQRAQGAASCVACKPGMHQPSRGATHCLFCKAGRFAKDEGSALCKGCPWLLLRWEEERSKQQTKGAGSAAVSPWWSLVGQSSCPQPTPAPTTVPTAALPAPTVQPTASPSKQTDINIVTSKTGHSGQDAAEIDCVVSAWQAWSECTVSCGGGLRSRMRMVLTRPSW